MLKRTIRKIAALSFVCSTAVSTYAAPSASSGGTPSTLGQGPLVYSKLTKEQLDEKVSSRYYVSQDIARSIDRDPFYPGRSHPSYTFLGYEHFPSPSLSYGFVVPFVYENFKFSRFKGNEIGKQIGILPYMSYLITPEWLFTGEVGISLEDYSFKDDEVSPVYRYRRQVFGHQAAGYLTWIGPDTPYTATIRGGFIYSNSRYRKAIDSDRIYYPSRHFEYGAFALSSRLKYYPDTDLWNAFIHVQADFRFLTTARPDVYRPDSGIQNRFLQFGPGFHYKISHTWELRGMLLHSIGTGYVKEYRAGLRLRAVM